ncbi:hypothetical protein L618_000400002510 [Rhodococcus rhodochrous J45]|uniref:Uncharacterized protein n=2 Tax=Rhodococcus rhodochrous TaxID=1829 RepID=A0A562DMD0_RHORH|nr:hypothetical protein L618_000400002510 [Rhodococcus rhodochrous J45]
MRGVFFDDKSGAITWYIDCIYGESDFEKIAHRLTELDFAKALESYFDARDFGDYQLNYYEVRMQRVRRLSDHYDRDHYSYYESLPGYL